MEYYVVFERTSGYSTVMTDPEYREAYGHYDADYSPSYAVFPTKEEAEEYSDKNNEAVRWWHSH